ncbi:MAG: tetratricopeptide repeat protein [Terracidiphilus sp.]
MPGISFAHQSGTGYTLRILARGAILWLPSLILFVTPMQAQHAGRSYQQTVLTIQQHIEANDLQGARTLITQAAKEFPADGGLENLLGVIEIQERHTERAKQEFSLAIQHSPKLVSAYLNLGRVYMETASDDSNERAEALHVYQKTLQIEPDNPEANYQSATLLMWSRSYQLSLDHLARLSAEAREGVGVKSLICADEAGLGHKENADRVATALAAGHDLTEQDAMIMLPALRAAHRADLVETIFAAAGNQHPLSASGLRILGLAQEAQGKLGPARDTLERAFAADGSAVAPLIDLARIANAQKDYRGALGYLAHAREMEPKDPSLPYEFGVICARMNLLEEARKAIGEAVKLAPDNPDYNLGMGMVASFEHDPTEGLPYLQKYHSLRPEDAEGILALGTTYFRAKDYDSASPWLKQAATKSQSAASAYYYLARIAREKGELDEALQDLSESAKLKPDQPQVLAETGQIYVQMKQYIEAEKLLTRAIALDADNYAANFGLLQLYVRTRDARQTDQSKRFEAIKSKNEQESREMMRVIEIDPKGSAAQ